MRKKVNTCKRQKINMQIIKEFPQSIREGQKQNRNSRSKQVIPRRNARGQLSFEKMLTLTSKKEKANYNNKISFFFFQS